MVHCLNQVNGRIRLKVPSFEEACVLSGVVFIQAGYTIPKNSTYLAGLVDTDGSFVLNFRGNRIDLNIEFQQNKYTESLDLSQVIPGSAPKVYKLIKRNQTKDKVFYSIRFSYQNVEDMLNLYNYFKLNRLYNDFKFYRAMQIKRFLELRSLHNCPQDSPEYRVYYNFVYTYCTHLNQGKPLPNYFKQIMI